ncbi:binding-protein-dependent transport system inner membrane protein [Clostridia bacterium]|nr:binding-protein-dependent transport system inner membrane protein [Clostridia bacterium]
MMNGNLRVKRIKAVKKYLFVLSLIGIQLIIFGVFYIGVNFNSILMAFQNVKADGSVVYTFDNFRLFFENFKNTSGLWIALRNTLIFFFFGLAMLPISFTTSYFMYKKVWGHKIFRVVFFFPTIISSVVWTNIYIYFVGKASPIAGLFQQLMGLEFPPLFLGDTRYAMVFVVLYSFWLGIAANFILFSGALVRIPSSVIEAGKLDGIGWFGELTKIVIPLVWPTLSTMVLLHLTGIFTASGEILLLTNGGYDTNTISFLIFANVYNGGSPSTSGTHRYAAAIGLFFTVLTFPILFFVTKLLNRVEDVKY